MPLLLRCPNCGCRVRSTLLIDHQPGGVEISEQPPEFSNGNLVVCGDCAYISIFEGHGFRKLTDAEWNAMPKETLENVAHIKLTIMRMNAGRN